MTLDPLLPLFYAVEVDTYSPEISAVAAGPGHATRAHLTPADASAPAASVTLRASDSGYRSRPTDTPPIVIYPPLLMDAYAIDRRLNLDPAGATSSVAWGQISFSNLGGTYDTVAAQNNSDGRAVRILAGQRQLDRTRGLYLDPSSADLLPLFTGIAQPWALSDTTLDIPFRDASYWIEQPLQSQLYGGTGGYDGGSDLVGVPKPKTRGGIAGNPVGNITPVLIDPTNRIYQYTDGPGTITALYEGGDTNITFQADTTNLYAGTTTSGRYRTDNSRGLFQLGTTPVRTITIDATGAFPVAGAQATLASIARYLLSEDMELPAGNLNVASFTALDAQFPYVAGVYYGPTSLTGVQALGDLLIGAGFKLLPRRDGTLALFAPRDTTGKMPVATLDPSVAVSCIPASLPTAVSPPPFRFRVGYQRNYTPSLSDISPAVTNMDLRSYFANEYRYSSWSSNAVLLAYRRPNDPAPIPGALLAAADAQSVANDLGALWGVRRRLYAVVVPAVVGLTREMGDIVNLVWPVDDLRNGRLGLVVGEQIRSADATSTLYILV